MNLDDLLARLREVTGDDAPTQRKSLISAAVQAEDVDLGQLAEHVREKSAAVDVEDGEITDEQVEYLSTLAEVSEGINDQVSAIEEERAAEARKATAAQLAERIGQTKKLSDDAPAAPTTVPAKPSEGGEPAPAETAVTAAGKRATPLAGMRRNTTKGSGTDNLPAARGERAVERYSMIASSDGPGVFSGQDIPSMDVLAAVAANKVQSLQRLGNATGRAGIATFNRHVDPALLVEEQMRDFAKLEDASNERLLPGGSLVAALEQQHASLVAAGNANGLGQISALTAAAAGYAWCSPMEIVNQLCPLEATLDGMVDLPTITTTKGGVMWPATADYADVFSSSPFSFTQDDMSRADFEKPCVEIDCADGWDQCVLEAASFCVVDNILLSRVDDSQIQRAIAQGLNIYRRGLNAKRIKRMLDITTALSGTQITVSTDDLLQHGPGLFESFLSFLELQVEHLRAKKRLSRTTTFEGLAPMWLRPILRSDLSKKLGIQDRWSITDADVDRWLLSRGIRLQYVWEWQDAAVDPASAIGGDVVPLQWPDTVQILLFQSGAFQAIQGPSVQLDAVYDRENLQKNKRVRMFLEDMWCLISRCGLKYLYDIPLCPNGQSGSHETITCTTNPPVEAAPLAATGVTAGNPTLTTVDVSWSWAQGEGGPATGFEVRYRTPIGFGSWSAPQTTAAASDRTLTVTGLQSDTQYEFQVTAVGAGGSTASTDTPAASTGANVPAAPTGVTVTDPTANSLTANWTWTQSGGGTVDQFEIAYRTPAGTGVWSAPQTAAAAARTHVISGLAAGTEYEVRVTAVGPDGSATGPTATGTTAAALMMAATTAAEDTGSGSGSTSSSTTSTKSGSQSTSKKSSGK
ncbi:major capsid protein [Streptomyces albogriseolus]|uniref:major capsid protein n=1 Tax=Streptomyces albogriseolus TaxID=1887 RepID=UPI003460B4C5